MMTFLCGREGNNLVIGAVLPSGQNTPKARGKNKHRPFLCVSLTGLHQSHKQKT